MNTEYLDFLQKFIKDNSKIFILLWATFIGVAVRMVFDSKSKKITLMFFLSRLAVAVFVGWIAKGWLDHHEDLQDWYGQILAVLAVISYEIVGLFINEAPKMIGNYFRNKYTPKNDEGDIK